MSKQPETFATRLRALRTEAGISQTELAARIGRKPPDVSAFEAGRREPTWATACKIADALGVTMDKLRG